MYGMDTMTKPFFVQTSRQRGDWIETGQAWPAKHGKKKKRIRFPMDMDCSYGCSAGAHILENHPLCFFSSFNFLASRQEAVSAANHGRQSRTDNLQTLTHFIEHGKAPIQHPASDSICFNEQAILVSATVFEDHCAAEQLDRQS
jgi:hypothetical protein